MPSQFDQTIKARFDTKWEMDKATGCWNWKGATRSGYGAIKDKQKVVNSHRYFYIQFKGEIPNGLVVRHTCNNKLCVNPDHLVLGTHKDNYKDAVKAGSADGLLNQQKRPIKHPSKLSYDKGCRCELCKEAKAESMRRYRKSRTSKNNNI